MDICLTKTLSNLLNKSSGSQAPAEHAVKNAEINITISNKDAVLTFTKDSKSIMKIPIESLLQELGLKATEENILILRKIITNKIPITTNKFEAISRLLVETVYKEELLDFLFNPYLRLILTREDQQEKTSLYFK